MYTYKAEKWTSTEFTCFAFTCNTGKFFIPLSADVSTKKRWMFQTSEYLDDCPSTISISSLVQSSLIFYYVTNFCSIIPTNLTLVKLPCEKINWHTSYCRLQSKNYHFIYLFRSDTLHEDYSVVLDSNPLFASLLLPRHWILFKLKHALSWTH